jgi:hypothetical protein
MFPCCDLCYEKYLNKDKSVNFIHYMNIVLERRRSGKETPDPDELCKCGCHIEGTEILH